MDVGVGRTRGALAAGKEHGAFFARLSPLHRWHRVFVTLVTLNPLILFTLHSQHVLPVLNLRYSGDVCAVWCVDEHAKTQKESESRAQKESESRAKREVIMRTGPSQKIPYNEQVCYFKL